MSFVSLPRATSEAQSVSSQAVLSFLDAAEGPGIDLHSLMVLRRGHVIAECWWAPYGSGLRHQLYSLTKSFMSTAVGLGISEGLLDLDEPIASVFPDKLPETPDKRLPALTLRHLLTMTSGWEQDIVRPGCAVDQDWVRGALAFPIVHEPGTVFSYNSTASYLAGAALQRRAGVTMEEYLAPRLFEPLGIGDVLWERCPHGLTIGGWGLSLKTEDIARFGQLYLQRGMWNGQRLVPATWVSQATSKQVSNGADPESDWNQGYGFQFWQCRHGIYRGDGAFGQYCIVMPERDAVVAITSSVKDMQRLLSLVWEHILPGLSEEACAPEKASETLRARLATLEAPHVVGQPSSPLAEAVGGRAYRLDNGEVKRYDFDQANADRWTEIDFPPLPGRVVARGAWTDDHTYAETVRAIETPFSVEIVSRFDDAGNVRIERTGNVGFGDAGPAVVVGRWDGA